MALLVVPRLGTNPSNVRVQYVFGLGDALSLMACNVLAHCHHRRHVCFSPVKVYFMYIIFIVPLNKKPGPFFNMVDGSDVVRIFH